MDGPDRRAGFPGTPGLEVRETLRRVPESRQPREEGGKKAIALTRSTKLGRITSTSGFADSHVVTLGD